MRLLVARPGWSLGLRRGQVEARGPGGEKIRVPLHELDAILVSTRGAMVSAALLTAAAEVGIPVYLVDGRGRVSAALTPAATYRGADKPLAQARWRLDPRLRLRAARWFPAYKLRARAWLLKLVAKTRGSWLRDYAYMLEARAAAVEAAGSLDEILRLEAEAGRTYWPALAEALRLEGFTGRKPRGGDPWNTLLDYAYSLLTSTAHSALLVAGLNPYIGFLHVDRSGRPSLALDYVEPYRWMAEWILYRLAGQGWRPRLEADGRLDHESRRQVLEYWARLSERVPGIGRPVEDVLRLDAWRLSRTLVEGGEWKPTLPR